MAKDSRVADDGGVTSRNDWDVVMGNDIVNSSPTKIFVEKSVHDIAPQINLNKWC